MKRSFCEVLLQYFPRISEFEDLHSAFIANCVFNSFLSYTAIVLNTVTIHAIAKTSSLPKTLKTLLLSLAASDVGVGLLAQPFYISLLVRWIQQEDPGCNTYKASNSMEIFFSTGSFFGVVAISVDRFLAIHLHLRYQELVTHKRVVAVVISIWVSSMFLSLMSLWVPPNIHAIVLCTVIVLGLAVTTMAYIRIYLAVRCHKNQIKALQVQQVAQTDEMEKFASLVKSVVGVFYIYLVFLVSCLPTFISWTTTEINGPTVVLKRHNLFSYTLVFLNSSLNPVVYCWKMRHIRHAIMDILRNMLWFRNQASR